MIFDKVFCNQFFQFNLTNLIFAETDSTTQYRFNCTFEENTSLENKLYIVFFWYFQFSFLVGLMIVHKGPVTVLTEERRSVGIGESGTHTAINCALVNTQMETQV